MESFEEKVVKAFKDGITDGIEEYAPELLSDIITDNPDWYADKLVGVFIEQVKKAFENKTFVHDIAEEIIKDMIDEADLKRYAERVIRETVKDSIIDKLIVEVKK